MNGIHPQPVVAAQATCAQQSHVITLVKAARVGRVEAVQWSTLWCSTTINIDTSFEGGTESRSAVIDNILLFVCTPQSGRGRHLPSVFSPTRRNREGGSGTEPETTRSVRRGDEKVNSTRAKKYKSKVREVCTRSHGSLIKNALRFRNIWQLFISDCALWSNAANTSPTGGMRLKLSIRCAVILYFTKANIVA